MSITSRIFRQIDRMKMLRFHRLYEKYKFATMIFENVYVDNLKLTSTIVSDSKFAGANVVECGTWRGGMSAGLIEIGGGQRRYCFFDSFEGLPKASGIDGPAALNWQADVSGANFHDNCTASLTEFRETIALTGIDESKIRIWEGLFEDTVATADTGPIGVLRLDGDWYASTKACLEAFWDKVVPGGIIIIDDYGVWDGCTRAVHEFLWSRSAPESIDRFGQSGVTFIRKRLGVGAA